MREVTDEALQRLYRACRINSGFPGVIPDESQGPPPTSEILDALGLMRPSLEDMGSTENLQRPVPTSLSNSTTHSDLSKTQHPGTTPPTKESFARCEHLPSPTRSSPNMESLAQSPNPRPTLATTPPLRPATPPEMGMCEQFLFVASENSSSTTDSDTVEEEYPYIDHSANSAVDLDAYLDMSSCSISTSGPHLVYNIATSRQYDNWAMAESSHATHQVDTTVSEPGIICDSYLSLWPGSLAAAYHTATLAHL
jgi:hypothetical protein